MLSECTERIYTIIYTQIIYVIKVHSTSQAFDHWASGPQQREQRTQTSMESDDDWREEGLVGGGSCCRVVNCAARFSQAPNADTFFERQQSYTVIQLYRT